MITLDDIMDMTGLTHAEIEAIALHESLPEVSAATLADRMMQAHHGPQAVLRMISEDIRAALGRDDLPEARRLYAVLHDFVQNHPDAVRGAAP